MKAGQRPDVMVRFNLEFACPAGELQATTTLANLPPEEAPEVNRHSSDISTVFCFWILCFWFSVSELRSTSFYFSDPEYRNPNLFSFFTVKALTESNSPKRFVLFSMQ